MAQHTCEIWDFWIADVGPTGILERWWNDPDHQEWRWSIELYNHR